VLLLSQKNLNFDNPEVFSRDNCRTGSGIYVRFSLPKVIWGALQFCFWPLSNIYAPSVTKKSNFDNPEVFSRHNTGTGSAADIRFSVLEVTWDALQFCSWDPKSYLCSFHQHPPVLVYLEVFSRRNSGSGIDIRSSLPKVAWGALQFCFWHHQLSVLLLSQKNPILTTRKYFPAITAEPEVGFTYGFHYRR
jgi:hypothetical protein